MAKLSELKQVMQRVWQGVDGKSISKNEERKGENLSHSGTPRSVEFSSGCLNSAQKTNHIVF